MSAEESHFYTQKISKNEISVNLSGENSGKDSEKLNEEINKLSKKGGGIILLSKGKYYLKDIQLKSNIQIKIAKDVVLQPYLDDRSEGKNILMFDLGNALLVENVAITNYKEDDENSDTWFKIIIPQGNYGGVKVAELGFLHNFKLSGFKIEDSYSKFSSIVSNLADNGNRNDISQGGIIKNIVATNTHVGYGIIQIQTGKRILCKNLDGQGGITMRVETGAKETNLVNEKTVDDIVGRNITVRNGDAAVDLPPHRVDQGRVDIEKIIAYNSTYAVRISAGFLDKKAGTVDNIGTFDSKSYIGDITATGGNNAQVKSKDFPFFSCEERATIASHINPDNESYQGRSIGVIKDNASAASGCSLGSDGGCYEVVIGKVVKTNINFVRPENSVYKSMAIDGCPKTPRLEKKPHEKKQAKNGKGFN